MLPDFPEETRAEMRMTSIHVVATGSRSEGPNVSSWQFNVPKCRTKAVAWIKERIAWDNRSEI